MNIVRLPPNQPHRFYRGGERIARFRGTAATDEYVPEDWVGSTTAIFGDSDHGLSRLENGVMLRDFIAGDGAALLPPGHTTTGLLVKLLDAGQRLPVHCHPDREFAMRRLGLPRGKTEAWLIIGVEGEAAVSLGFSEPMTASRLAELVFHQDTDALLGSLNRVPVEVGDVVFVPAGLPHAIGEGIFMVEVQEPSDLSILLEWRGLHLDSGDDPYLGLTLDEALEAVDLSAWTPQRLAGIRRSMAGTGERIGLLPPEAAPFFGAERLRPIGSLELEPSFSILVVIGGEGRLESVEDALELKAGETLLVGYGAGPVALSGPVDVLRCTPAADSDR